MEVLDVNSILVYYDDNNKMVDRISSLSKNYINPTVLCCLENVKLYSAEKSIKNIISIASKNDLEDYSKNLFSSFRKAYSLSFDIIFVEGVKKEGLGIAIMNRLENMCNKK